MVRKDKEQRREKLLRCVCSLPQKIIAIHGIENMTEFLLHQLCSEECFNFDRAVYLVENPDFNHVKGIAGFEKNESYQGPEHWQSPDKFSEHMKQASFNQKVRFLETTSPHYEGNEQKDLIDSVSKQIGISNSSYHTWDTKYNNKGIFIFELSNPEDQELIDDHLEESLYLFGFCPIF